MSIPYHSKEYEEYDYDEKVHAESLSRKGKSKKEAHLNAKSHSGALKAGQERKIVNTIAKGEEKRNEQHKVTQ